MPAAGAATATRRDPADVLRAFGRAVGATPIVHLVLEIAGRPRRIGIKLEGENPCGSIKDRTAVSLLESVGAARLADASLLVESTSGNLGVSFAYLARQLGLEFLAVVDPKLSPSVRERMRALGARIDTVRTADRTGGYLLSRLDRVRQVMRTTPGAVWPDQYTNPANPRAHRLGTGPEIVAQTDGRVDAVFVAVSTGGTVAGIAAHLREANPGARIVGVDAVGSVVFENHPGPRRLSGIGASRRSDFIVAGSTDAHVLVGDEPAFAFCRSLLGWTGLRVGGSSGAVLAGCVRYLARHPEITAPVCVAADTGDNYAKTIFNDDYLRGEGITLGPDLLRPGPGLPPVRCLGMD